MKTIDPLNIADAPKTLAALDPTDLAALDCIAGAVADHSPHFAELLHAYTDWEHARRADETNETLAERFERLEPHGLDDGQLADCLVAAQVAVTTARNQQLEQVSRLLERVGYIIALWAAARLKRRSAKNPQSN